MPWSRRCCGVRRQRAKIISALVGLDADVVGLIEIENDRSGMPADYAAADLVMGLNDILGAGTYDYIPTGAIGTDAIKTAVIYRPANVTPIGTPAILDSTYNPLFLDTYNRPVLAVTFIDNLSEQGFTVAVNHLKSKSSSCEAIGDPDLGDGAETVTSPALTPPWLRLTGLPATQPEQAWKIMF